MLTTSQNADVTAPLMLFGCFSCTSKRQLRLTARNRMAMRFSYGPMMGPRAYFFVGPFAPLGPCTCWSLYLCGAFLQKCPHKIKRVSHWVQRDHCGKFAFLFAHFPRLTRPILHWYGQIRFICTAYFNFCGKSHFAGFVPFKLQNVGRYVRIWNRKRVTNL